MMNVYSLPTALDCSGQILAIRNGGDWRTVIDVCIALSDPALSDMEKILAAMTIFYEAELSEIKDPNKAVELVSEFIAAGENGPQTKKPKLIDWETDAGLIVSGVNAVLGKEIRAEAYMHWWTFIAAYMGIGESALATVVGIRDKIARGKKLEKYEQEFKRNNPQYFGVDKRAAEAGADLLKELIGE